MKKKIKKEVITRTLTRVTAVVKVADPTNDTIYSHGVAICTMVSPDKVNAEFITSNAVIPAETVLLAVVAFKTETVKATWALDDIVPYATFTNEKGVN